MKKLSTFQSIVVSLLVSGPLPVYFMYHQYTLTQGVVDAQGGIVILFAIFIGSLIWGVLAFSIHKTIKALQNKKAIAATSFIVIAMSAIGFNAFMLADSFEQEYVLAAAKDPNTQQEELARFVGFKTNFGYKVDNLVASNPSSSIATLETLYKKKNQIGTLTSLASNPLTPDWILIELSRFPDAKYERMMTKALLQNPRVKSGELNLELPDISEFNPGLINSTHDKKGQRTQPQQELNK